ncbi:uncharacterized protein LOC123311512 [Coccinella septempunctata]|uniref:uncharacterized protein LOC123311512 n=1 Tax=Coccinella septempunctata TaxID=41139 RepID=UPI001D07EEB0|nr:uncharacterized protein LOC123311512 [Coccinella septempunctata]
MEENFIYDDLATQGDLGEMINDLQTKNNELQQHVCSLEQDIVKLCDKITEMKTVQDNLSKNISELFNTAKNELERKDRRIGELQNQLDDLIFRRRQPNSALKRKWEESYPDEINKRPRTKNVNISHSGEADEIILVNDEQESCKDLSGLMCKNIPVELNPESDNRVSQKQESDLRRLTHSKENTYSREKREYHKDTYRNDYRDRNANRSRTEEKEIRKDYRDVYRENRDYDRRYRDRGRGRGRGHRNSIQEYRTNPRDYRDNWRNNRDSHSGNNQRQSNEHDFRESNKFEKYASNHRMDRHSGTEPVFSSGKATHSNSVAEDNSIEEGEVFDEEPRKGTEIIEENILNKNLDAVRNLSFEVQKSQISHKSMVEQERRTRVKNSVRPHQRDHNNQEDKLKDLKNKNMVRDKQNLEKNGKDKLSAENPVIEINNVNDEDMKGKQGKLVDKVIGHEDNKIAANKHMERNNEKNVKIISQIILNEGAKDISKECASKSEVKNDTECKIQDKKENPPITLKTERRKRESRVPRNLTEELNINLERSKKTKDLMYELFGSSEKKKYPSMLDQVSPKSLYSLSDDGEMPKLKFFNSDIEKPMSNSHSMEVKKDSNPVTEFQIFKTNLPCLEKSNSLSSISIQIQKPDIVPTNKESLKKSQPEDEKFSLMKENKVSNQKEEYDQVLIHQASSEEAEKKENFGQSTNDICSMSFIDLDIRQLGAENFPNMNAVSESKGASHSLLTPVQENLEIGSQKCITQVVEEKKVAITNIDEKEPIRKKHEKSHSLSIHSDHIEKPSQTGNETKNDTPKTILKECQFSSGKDDPVQPKSNVCDNIPTKDNKPQSVLHSNHPQQKYISDILTPSEGTEHMFPRESIDINGIPRIDLNNTKKPQDPKKTNKSKSVSPSKIKIQKQCHSTKVKEEIEIPYQGDEKFKHSPVDKINKPSKQKRTEKCIAKESIAQVPIEDKNLSESTGPVTNTKIHKSTNSSKSVVKSVSKDMADLLSVSVQDNIKTIPKKCTTSTKTEKTGNCKNRDNKDIDSFVPTSSKKPPKACNKKVTSLSGKDAKIKSSNSLEAPVNKKVEDITHQKPLNQPVSKLDRISTEAVKEPQSYKEATSTQVHKNCKTEKDVSDSTPTQSADPNVIEKGASDTNVNIATTNMTVSNLSLTTEKKIENINLNKRQINQNACFQASPENSSESRTTNNSDRKRRRCAIKLV